jgi:hypothetical protein
VIFIHWRRLATESDDQLRCRDLGHMNLACSFGLPGCERIDYKFCISWLDRATQYARRFISKALPGVRRKPAEYRSEGHAKVLCLITALQRDLGVKYNPEKIPEEARFNVEDVFLPGAIQGAGGTCASLPVLYATIGRRLGYPLRLVKAKRHLFCRWEGEGERFNIEGAGRGLCVFPDDYYRTGRYEMIPGEEQACGLLGSLTPRQELADFLCERGLLWAAEGNWRECVDSFVGAIVADPETPTLKNSFTRWMHKWQEELIRCSPPGFPAITILPYRRLYPQVIPSNAELDIHRLSVAESVLNDPEHEGRWWSRLRRGECGVGPLGVQARVRADGGYDVSFQFGAL